MRAFYEGVKWMVINCCLESCLDGSSLIVSSFKIFLLEG